MAAFWIGFVVGVVLASAVLVLVLAPLRTERRIRRLVRRAQAAERLAELGTLTGGLAHEIKNPLSSVGLNIQLVQEDLSGLAGEGEAAAEKVGRIQRRIDALARETARLREILEDFLRFAGRMQLDLTQVDVNQLVDELVDFLAPQAQASAVRVHTQLAASPAALRADAGLLKQALLNLVINAVQAMAQARQDDAAHGGARELIVRTERSTAGGHQEIVIHVTDTGPGMAREVLQKAFQPYFSTKRGGTGLGLPTARRIIEEHGGTLSVHSEPGRGSDFIVHLPIAGPPAKAPPG